MEPLDLRASIYRGVIQKAREQGIEFAVGGGLAVAQYTTHRESTKDIDLYVEPGDRGRMIEVVHSCGLADYYETAPYDRNWIYRSYSPKDAIVDVMWAMPNRRAQVDRDWLRRGPEVQLFGEQVRLLAPEELIWAKLYVLQRDRCDWPDIINLIYATADGMDWEHLVRRVGDDAPLLGAVLTIFRWLCPEQASRLPGRIWHRLAESVRKAEREIPREDLLDSRPWFLPSIAQPQVGSQC